RFFQVSNPAGTFLLKGLAVCRHLPGRRGTVARIRAGNNLQNERSVFYRAGQRSNLIKRGSIGDDALSGYPAVSRLEAYNAAERGRLSHRSAGIGTQCGMAQTRLHSYRGTARRSARHPGRIGRVQYRPVKGRLVGSPHGELVAIESPDD